MDFGSHWISCTLCELGIKYSGGSLGPMYFLEFGCIYLEGVTWFPHFEGLLGLVYFEGYLD